MLAVKRLASVAPGVNLRITQVTNYINEGSTIALKPRAEVIRASKQ